VADDDVIERVVTAGARATRIIGDDLLGRAVQAAPIEEGTLRGSGHVVYIVNDHEFAASEFQAAVRYAVEQAEAGLLRHFYAEVRFSTVYAAAQHEGIAFMQRGDAVWVWQARNYPRGGGPKYLERPLMDMTPRYLPALASSIEPQLR
jgi:hypothetical protein